MSGFSLKQFPSGLDPSTRRNEWSLWRERLMILISLKPSIKSQKDKKGFLVLVGGPEIQKALRGQAVSGEVTNAHPIPEFDNAILRLDNHFNSGTHQMTDIIRFTNLRQKPEEQFIDFVHRLQQYASVCDFKGSEESQILLQIRKGAIHSKKLSKMITREQKTLAEVINYGSTLDNEASFETTKPKKAEDVPGSSYSENADISYVSRPPFRGRNSYPFDNRYTPFQENYRGRGRGRARGRGQSYRVQGHPSFQPSNAYRGYQSNRSFAGRPAVTCYNCRKQGHLARECRSRQPVSFIREDNVLENVDNKHVSNWMQ